MQRFSLSVARLGLPVMMGLLMATASGAADFQAARPMARIDYWQQRQADISAELASRKDLSKVRLVFLGDSITDFWHLEEDPWMKGRRFGRSIWDATFGGATPENYAINLGISGDRTEHILNRVRPLSQGGLGHLDAPGLDPEFIVLLAGINNSWTPEEPVADSVFEGVRAVVLAVHERKPKARIILQSLLPTNDPARNHDVVEPVNRRLAALASDPAYSGYLLWLNLHPSFLKADGSQISEDFVDGLHPDIKGYTVWRDRLVAFLSEVRGKGRSASASH
jgi:lysophospholipase L1-like esterase